MNKKITQFRLLAATLMFVAAMVVPTTAWAESTITPSMPSGNGTADSPYLISSADELYWFAGLVNGDVSVCTGDVTQNKAACAKLTENIVVNDVDFSNYATEGWCNDNWIFWIPIGKHLDNIYTGTFDGQNHTISGLYFDSASYFYPDVSYDQENDGTLSIGLFGYNAGTIKNVGVIQSCFIWKDDYVGGVCGYNNGGTIDNCYNQSKVVGSGCVGGVCGNNYSGTVTNCYNTGSVEGSEPCVGGVCGDNGNGGTIENCDNKGAVSGGTKVGGVCGNNSGTITNCHNTGTDVVSEVGGSGGVCGYNSGEIKKCYNKAKVTCNGTHYNGGVCGENFKTITDCYNTGAVSGTSSDVGGVCGYNALESSSTITNCYNTGAVSGSSNVGGVCGSNSGTIGNCYYLSGCNAEGTTFINEDGTSKTTDEFKSGEVCYLLNKGKTDGSQAWYQNLSAESGDAYPVLTSTEGNTVYGGYQHGETTIHYSNSASDYPHAHAYDSSATDEASGNHDKSYQGFYTWTDNVDKTDATVTATFTCAVCGKVETPGMAAFHDDEQTNTPATCTENGYNYYKTSYAFAGATFTDNYTQTVPAGHNMTAITFNDSEKIYSNQCQRMGCGYIGYYATSDGMVEATYEDGVYKVPFLRLNDGLAYDSKAEFTVTDFTYNRTFSHDKWVAVYVPFAIDCDELGTDFEMAVINNFHEYEQEDGSYNVVLEVKRKTSGTIPALTPCVMRLKTEPASATEKEFQLSNVPFSAAADNYIDYSSVTRYYKFTGSLAGKAPGSLSDETDFVLNEGTLHKANAETTLKAQRWYLSAEDRAGSGTSSAAMLSSISIDVIGDNEGEGGGTITSIDTFHLIEGLYTEAGRIYCPDECRIYDLLGRDVTRLNGSLCGVYVVKIGEAAVKVVVR